MLIIASTVSEQLDLWYEESTEQLSDEDYNRNKALNYLWNDFSRSYLGYVFGNGFASTHANFGKLMFSNMEEGIYQSDLGLFGLWTHFGLIIIFLIIKVIYGALRLRNKSLGILMMGIHVVLANILFSAITPEQILFWVIFIGVIKIENFNLVNNLH
jgi:hypothetical protein